MCFMACVSETLNCKEQFLRLDILKIMYVLLYVWLCCIPSRARSLFQKWNTSSYSYISGCVSTIVFYKSVSGVSVSMRVNSKVVSLFEYITNFKPSYIIMRVAFIIQMMKQLDHIYVHLSTCTYGPNGSGRVWHIQFSLWKTERVG